ncbi:DNA-directed RNA polymerase [archaeon]|nr:DNA-directed RNA polymerase [archaeon]|tara:strand:+ start:2811 stop:3392 length:582 start_codon:yes stop_codon:yes gene_type:complete
MFYEVKIRSHIRIPPDTFKVETKKAVLEVLKKKYENFVSKDLGFVIGVTKVLTVGDGIIIPGDGASYYDSSFKILVFKPELQEVVLGKISDITDFGAFISIGASDAMIHISQTMDDFVSFSKSGVLTGKETKRVLKTGDKCRARIVALSYKEISNPKIGLTMRQPKLGNLNWIDKKEEVKKEKEPEKKDKKEK